MNALERAAKAIGNKRKLASVLGVSPQAVSKWRRVPAERVLQIEAATDGKVTRSELRPDIYPPEE